ncbi:MAG: hypothetical protein OHK0013_01470 [Sandaracinaceae bacterium]
MTKPSPRRGPVWALAPWVCAAFVAAGCAPQVAIVDRTTAGVRRRAPWVPPSGYEHFVRAELAAEAGRLREAIAEYELARSGVIDGYLLAREADAAARLPDVALAERLVAEGLTSDPTSEPLLLLRARLARERGDHEGAERALRAAMEAAPSSDAAVLALADLMTELGRADEARAALDAFVATRPEDVAALRALVVRATLAGDVRVAAVTALRLVRVSPVHRPEVLRAVEAALDAGQSAVAHAVLRAIPIARGELDLRFRAALAVHDRSECERLALREDDGTREGRLRAAERWIALGDGARAEEIARSVALEAPSARADRIVAEGLLLQGQPGRAAEVLAAIGPGSSEDAARDRLLEEALAAAGLPALGLELASAPRMVSSSR